MYSPAYLAYLSQVNSTTIDNFLRGSSNLFPVSMVRWMTAVIVMMVRMGGPIPNPVARRTTSSTHPPLTRSVQHVWLRIHMNISGWTSNPSFNLHERKSTCKAQIWITDWNFKSKVEMNFSRSKMLSWRYSYEFSRVINDTDLSIFSGQIFCRKTSDSCWS